MTKSILTFVDETRRDENVGGWLSHNCFFFLNFYAHHWLNVARSVSIPPPLPEMPPDNASDALTNVMMAEVQALGTGRKIRIDIWTVFNYNLTENKTQCTAITGEKPCGFKIGGKNTTRGTWKRTRQPCHLCQGKLASNCQW